MNWGRVKTIFIILFLISDLFLFGILVDSEWRQGVTSPEVIDSTVQILKNNGIGIDADVIPKKVSDVPYAEAENVITGYDSFAKLLLGDNMVKMQEIAYESPEGVITFSGNSFSFSSKAQASPDAAASEKEAESIAAEFLSELGFNLKNSEKHIEKTDAGYNVTFVCTIDGLPVFDTSVAVGISGNAVASASGVWFNLLNISGPDNSLKSAASVLIDSIQDIVATGEISLTGLSLGYSIPESHTYHKSAVLVPVWKIQSSTGDAYYLDARNPE